MRIAVIDDERPARSELIHLLKEIMPEAEIAEADRGSTGLELISSQPQDLVFIDIHLGDIKGTTLARAVKKILPGACIVFATAFSEYAVEGYEIGVSNYLLKPFSKNDLERVLSRCLEAMESGTEQPALKKIPVNSERKVIMVDVNRIVYIETESRGCLIHTLDASYREKVTIGEYEKKLDDARFMRIHKSYIINLDHVHEILPWHNNGIAVNMKGWKDKPIPVARGKTRMLKQYLHIS